MRTKILVVDNDHATLSRIYLALVHRNYKVEASDNPQEITERIKRFRPALLIIGENEYASLNLKFKIPCILLVAKVNRVPTVDGEEIYQIENPVQIDALVKKIEEVVV